MLLKLNLARNSLRYIIKTYNIKELHIPYYICPTIRQSILKENCKIKFYHIDDKFMPDKNFEKTDYILYPNYFGICDKNVDILTDKYPFMIIDNAHSFYSEPKGFACFNSARKFMPVFNGSYLYINDAKIKLQEQTGPVKYDFKEENNFENYNIELISEKLDRYIQHFDLKEKRKEQFLKLYEKYGKTNCLKFDTTSYSPFCYPYLAKTNQEASILVSKLEQEGYCIYRYWNNLPKSYNEYKFYRRLVPIPLSSRKS